VCPTKRPSNRINTLILISGVLIACILGGCGKVEPARRNGKLAVAVSIVPQAWLTQQIGGDLVDVFVVVQPGEGPETFQPTDAQVSRVMQSAVFFRLGLPFERGAWFDAIQKSRSLRVEDTSAGIKRRKMEAHAHHDGHDHGHHDHHHHHGHEEHNLDPHVWTTPKLLSHQAKRIATVLAQLDPDNAQTYQDNLASLEASLDETDAQIRETLKPFSGKSFFIFHPSWGYFADEYGLTQVAIETEGKNPSDADLTRLQKQARESGIRVVFVQPQNAGPGADAIAKAVNGEVQTIDPLAENVLENMQHVAGLIADSYKSQ